MLYSRPRVASDAIPGMEGVLSTDDVNGICEAFQALHGRQEIDSWPMVMDAMAAHAQYTIWQPDPSMWCYGGRAQRVRATLSQ